MNRIDKVIVFRSLTAEHFRQILDIKLNEVYQRIVARESARTFTLHVTPEAKDFLLKEGTDPKYGARHLKRAIERFLVFPLSSLISTRQIESNEVVSIALLEDGSGLTAASPPEDAV
jgi:ATP-dependent Clp protease ATP-binding subunit ClpB